MIIKRSTKYNTIVQSLRSPSIELNHNRLNTNHLNYLEVA